MEAQLVKLESLLTPETKSKESTNNNNNNNVDPEEPKGFQEINWMYLIGFGAAHVFGFFGIILLLQGKVLLSTIITTIILGELGGYGITIGGHRLWAHRTFKAKTPLKIILAICFSLAGQHSIWRWASWHRVHHKYVDTHADPHNSRRGFFYSHIGWLLMYDHDVFTPSLKKVDMSDLKKEPIVMWHKNNFVYLYLPTILILPTLIPWYFFGESLYNAFCVTACLRYVLLSHRTFLVNSAAHMWGSQPYDKTIMPRENKFVSLVALGEGWHNYHHVFPWDYKTSELGLYRWNASTAIIDFFAWIGWAYDLKSVSHDIVMQRVKRTGDPEVHKHHPEGGAWGWGDKDIPQENIQLTETSYPAKEE